MKIHVLTALTRPENLSRVAESLASASTGFAIHWHLRLDLERRHVGGQALKNQMLDEIADGWVWILDDDTTVHPDLFYRAGKWAIGSVNAVVVSQQRADARTLVAEPGNVRVGSIDIGQAILRRDLIGEHRIPEHYDGDGMFLAELLPGAVAVYLEDVLSLHNALDRPHVTA